MEEEVGESVNVVKCYQLGKLGEEDTTVAWFILPIFLYNWNYFKTNCLKESL